MAALAAVAGGAGLTALVGPIGTAVAVGTGAVLAVVCIASGLPGVAGLSAARTYLTLFGSWLAAFGLLVVAMPYLALWGDVALASILSAAYIWYVCREA
jgi:hypothetical protein